jgi:hypothetical protein
MAGKAKPTVKKLGVKKPTVKKPTTAAKKPGVKKPTAAKKKPATGAKFNINKLIMLIARGAPKKSNKMTGGYDGTRIKSLTDLIDSFISSSYDRIKTRAGSKTTTNGGALNANGNINDPIFQAVEAAITEKSATPAPAGMPSRLALIVLLAAIPIPNLGDAVPGVALVAESGLIDVLEPETVPQAVRGNDFDKRVFDVNYMIIVITLCKVRQLFIREVRP